jgi:enamine deaminase RidA (YjgF/YER057c/UK114 family)
MSDRRRISSGSSYEPAIGFSRALRVGHNVYVSGTAPIWPDGSCAPDPEIQARRCLEIILEALRKAGAAPEDVVRTRMFITDPGYADAVGRAHSAVFGEVRPAATMVVVVGMLDSRWKVEIEADAIIGKADTGNLPNDP